MLLAIDEAHGLMIGLFNAAAAERASVRNHARSVASIGRVQVGLGRWLAENTPTEAAVMATLLAMVSVYSVLFHYLMAWEGRQYSWITGVYWTLTVY